MWARALHGINAHARIFVHLTTTVRSMISQRCNASLDEVTGPSVRRIEALQIGRTRTKFDGSPAFVEAPRPRDRYVVVLPRSRTAMPSHPRSPLSIRLPLGLLQEVRDEARARGVSVSQFIRGAVREALDKSTTLT